ncbi:glutaredoxin family protein [Methylomonas montana]|uniref:glutaredoxin family protein n=1 Tax=Methylomonas montana TaxID=3058963 RepID=UPI002659C77C|nr:glutaredoxin family protein [Methylomonas montana]WKJ90351.1 glutaredoxin family protein [Methylomonas montana]
MVDFILFGTAGCHLCEEAEALLTAAGIGFDSKDIIDDEQCQQQYGLLIPVLLHQASGQQLNWPFDRIQLTDFVRQTG